MLFLHKTLALAGFRAICRSALKKHRNFRHCCLLEIPKRPCKLIKNPDKHCKRQSYYILLLLVSTCGVQDRKKQLRAPRQDLYAICHAFGSRIPKEQKGMHIRTFFDV
jgi:hypothetical protein